MLLYTKVEITYKNSKELVTQIVSIPTVTGDLWEDVARFLDWKEDMKKPCDPLWYLSMKNIKTIKRITDEV